MGDGGNSPSDNSHQLYKFRAITKAMPPDYFHMSELQEHQKLHIKNPGKKKKQLELTLQPFVATRQISSARFSPYSIHLQLKTFQEP